MSPGHVRARSHSCADGVPPVQQERGLPPALEGLPDKVPCNGSYRYVLFHLWFITITRKSVSVAIAASCLTFVALQVGHETPCSSRHRHAHMMLSPRASVSLQSASASPDHTCGPAAAMPCTASAAQAWHPRSPGRPVIPCAVQSASLCLTTTPAEELALGLKFWLAPLRVMGAPVDEICMTLLLSLRFMSVVFDELRNLSLGLAARSVPWKRLPPGAGLTVRSCLCGAGLICAPPSIQKARKERVSSELHSPQSRQSHASCALAAPAM